MALIPCSACGNKVSRQAPTCPRCGHPIGRAVVEPAQKPTKKWGWKIVSTIACILLLAAGVGKIATQIRKFQDARNVVKEWEKVDLRGPAPRVGDVLHGTGWSQLELADAKISLNDTWEKEIAIRSVDGRAVTKFQTKHIKDIHTKSVLGKRSEENEPLAGSTVVSEKIGGRWRHALAKGEADEKQNEALGKESGWDDQEEIPASEQPVGSTWEEDANSKQKLLGAGTSISSASGKFTYTFVRIEQYQGERCAVIEGKGKLVLDTDSGTMTMDVISDTTYRSLDSGYDLKETSDWQVVLKTNEGTEAKGRMHSDEKTELGH